MAGTVRDNSAPCPISPAEALNLVRATSPEKSVDEIAADLTDWIADRKLRVWADGHPVPCGYAATQLMVEAFEEDGTPQVKVVSKVGRAWAKSDYRFKFDTDEVRVLLPLTAKWPWIETPDPVSPTSKRARCRKDLEANFQPVDVLNLLAPQIQHLLDGLGRSHHYETSTIKRAMMRKDRTPGKKRAKPGQ